jgi:hypothetical protein
MAETALPFPAYLVGFRWHAPLRRHDIAGMRSFEADLAAVSAMTWDRSATECAYGWFVGRLTTNRFPIRIWVSRILRSVLRGTLDYLGLPTIGAWRGAGNDRCRGPRCQRVVVQDEPSSAIHPSAEGRLRERW